MLPDWVSHKYRILLFSIKRGCAQRCARACVKRGNKKKTIVHTCQQILCKHRNRLAYWPCAFKAGRRGLSLCTAGWTFTTCVSLWYQKHHSYTTRTHTQTHTHQFGSGSNQIAALESSSESCFPASVHPCSRGSSPLLQ